MTSYVTKDDCSAVLLQRVLQMSRIEVCKQTMNFLLRLLFRIQVCHEHTINKKPAFRTTSMCFLWLPSELHIVLAQCLFMVTIVINPHKDSNSSFLDFSAKDNEGTNNT